MNLAKPNQNITFKVGATNMQLQRAIEAALPAATEQMKDKAKEFKGSTEKQTCYNIFNFLITKIHYKVDGDNQKIKLPSAFLREKEGDCKSYSLFTASILANLKIPFSFTYASYNPTDSTPEHIYVTTKKGCIIDAVYKKFDAEKKATYKFQKPMNISYISGIKRHSEKYETKEEKYHLPKSLGKSYSPSIGALSSNMGGIGRTGYDWAKAVGIDKYYSETKYYLKNLNPVLAAERSVLQTVLSKNGGGLSNYLWSISPFNDSDREDTTKKALYFGEVEMVLKSLIKKYNVQDEKVAYNPAPAGAFISKESFKASSSYNGPLTVKYVPSNNATVFTPEIQYGKQFFDAAASKANNFTKELEAAKIQIYAKYPYIISRKSTPKMHEAYRKLETWYFWEMGGSPDDLNDAVKEGNTKTPTGASFNLYIRQRLEGKNPSIGLGIQASVSAVFGFKYNPDTKQIIDPATNKAINGTSNGVGALAEISALILKILAWIAGFGKIMGGIIACLLIIAVTLIAMIIIAPDFTRDLFGIKGSNGQNGMPTVDDQEIQRRLLQEQNTSGFEGMLIPVGVVAAFLILSK
jgi:hypothetical protein